MRIIIETIPHKRQRYDTIGDWYTDKHDGTVRIKISGELNNWKYVLLVAVHELVEAFLCMSDGVAEEHVDKFDKSFVEKNHEPGDDPKAPYKKQHCIATGFERILAACLGVDWLTYEDKLDSVSQEEKLYNAVVKCSTCTKTLGSVKGVKIHSFVQFRPCEEHKDVEPFIEWEPQ